MSKQFKHIHPIFEQLMQRGEKENFLNQNAKVIWLTGLSGSGKSTIAQGLESVFFNKGYFVQVLDGDNIRTGISNNLGFSQEDRQENIRRISEVSKLFLEAGIITICSFVSPTKKIREIPKSTIGKDDFIEIFVNTPLEICESRDVKGLYKKARSGEIKDFTGISSPFEAPENPDFDAKTADKTIEETVMEVAEFLLPKISK
ncbi:MAG: adenylyl-sulfate kinase [Chitinophagales bacterium]